MTKKQIIGKIKELIHNNFDLLWNSSDEDAYFYLSCNNIYKMRNWNKKRIEAALNILVFTIKRLQNIKGV